MKPYKPDPITVYVGGIFTLMALTFRMCTRLSKEEIIEMRKNPVSEDVKQNFLLLIYEETKTIPTPNVQTGR